MINEDFCECDFIEKEMKYYTYHDFCENRQVIKRLFKELSYNGKIFYKYYVYANIHMNLTYKNKIWDYLNGYDDNAEELKRMQKFYKVI